ncbi:MAG: FUSC family protein [Frankia sp.]|nr:FUSC family protein [Frankia sp.]
MEQPAAREPVPEPGKGAPLRAIFQLNRLPPGRVGIAVIHAVATGVPLTIGWLLGRVPEGLTAALGAVTAVYYPMSSWGYRARALPVVAVGSSIATTVGAAAGGERWRTSLAVAAVAFVATLLKTAIAAPPPGAVPFVVVAAVATQLPPGYVRLEVQAGLTLAGATFAYLLTMVGARWDRAGPTRRAVVRALDALAEMLAALGGPRADATRHEAGQAIRQAEVMAIRDRVDSELADLATSLWGVFQAGVAYGTRHQRPPPPAASARLRSDARHVARTGRVPTVPVWTGVQHRSPDWVRLAAAIDDVGMPPAGPTPPPVIPPMRDLLAEGLRRGSPAWPWAARAGLATFGAALLAISAGIERPYWAPVAAATVLEVRTARIASQRSAQRAIGTAIGAAAAFALRAAPLPMWSMIIVATVLQGAAQVLIVANYALGTILLTPLTLLLVEFAHPGIPPSALIGPRIFDTLLGILVGLAAALALWPRAATHSLPRALADCIDATGELLAARLAASPAPQATPSPVEIEADLEAELLGRPTRWIHPAPRADGVTHGEPDPAAAARHHVEATLTWLSELQADAENEPGASAQAAWPAVVAARRLGYLVLAEPPGLRAALRTTPVSPVTVQSLFERLAAGVLGDAGPPPREPPQLPEFPPLRHEFAAMVDAVPAGAAATRSAAGQADAD